jgi:hypothetical protein
VTLIVAAIGIIAAIAAQIASSRLSRRRDREANVRRLAAAMLAAGRVIQTHVGNARSRALHKGSFVDLVTQTLGPFVGAGYELKWSAPEEIRKPVIAYQDALNRLIRDWDVQRDGMLDQELVDAANALDGTLTNWARKRRVG